MLCNALAYWAYLLVMKKMRCFEYDPKECSHNTSFFILKVVLNCTKLERLASLANIGLHYKALQHSIKFKTYFHAIGFLGLTTGVMTGKKSSTILIY